MKILHVILFYYNRGGDNTYHFSLMKILEKKGHKNIVFSMHHPQNFESEYSKYFVSHIDYAEEIKKGNLFSAVKVLSKAIFSLEAKRNMERLIKDEKPDLVHVQSLHHHITPSIFYPIKKHGIPIVWTLHDYSLICPNTSFLSHGNICEKCKKNKIYWAIFKKCKKDSLGASVIAMLETSVHRILGITEFVDVFITPSRFLRNKLIEFGIDEEKIECLNNILEIKPTNGTYDEEGYVLYIGRLSKEKGIKTLINAVMQIDSCRLKIVGEGQIQEELTSFVKEKGGHSKIEFLGHKKHEEVIELIRRSSFVVVPSEWYENYPYSVLESFACGKAVIGARIGGIPEMVEDYKTGLTFESGNVDELISKIKYFIDNPEKTTKMGQNARMFFEKELNAEKHYEELIKIYKKIVKNKN